MKEYRGSEPALQSLHVFARPCEEIRPGSNAVQKFCKNNAGNWPMAHAIKYSAFFDATHKSDQSCDLMGRISPPASSQWSERLEIAPCRSSSDHTPPRHAPGDSFHSSTARRSAC